jgi:hypothetical protein
MEKIHEEILGVPTEPKSFSTFVDFTPYERQIIMAELYHNAWYDQERFEEMYDLYNKWANNPLTNRKFILPHTKNLTDEEQVRNFPELHP